MVLASEAATRRRQQVAKSVVESEVENAAHRWENPRRPLGKDQEYEIQSSALRRIIIDTLRWSGRDILRR